MYKNQLQELAQRSCFSLPSYTCVREGPDHAPRFKAIVNFNAENFEGPHYCSTLRQAEHSAAESALASLSSRHSIAARILDETGVYKNLLQEIAQRVGSPLPQYTAFRSSPGHPPVFTGTVDLAGIIFTGEPAKNKKQAEKNAALAAWLSLKLLAQQESRTPSEHEWNEEQEQIRIARALQNYRLKEKMVMQPNIGSVPFQNKFSSPTPRPLSPQQRPTAPTSKILPFFSHKTHSQTRPPSPINNSHNTLPPETRTAPHVFHTFPAVGAAPYVPFRQCRTPHHGIAQPVTIRSAVPVFSAPPPRPVQPRVAPPVCIRQAVPALAAAPSAVPVKKAEEIENCDDVDESTAVRCLEQLEI